MIPSSLGSDELNMILRQFALYPGKIDSWKKIPQKFYNNNYFVEIDGEAWVIKSYPSSAITRRFKLSQEVNLVLQDKGLPVAKLELTKKNSPLALLDNTYYTLHRWVKGVHLSPFFPQTQIPEKAIEEVASTLARIHLAVTDGSFLTPTEDSVMRGIFIVNKPSSHCKLLVNRRNWLLSKYSLLRFKFKKNQFDKWILKRVPFIVELANKLRALNNAGGVLGVEEIPIHNDINWDNLIFDDNNRLLAVIDFDNVVYAPRLYEVGAAAIVVAGPNAQRINKFILNYDHIFRSVSSEGAVWVAMMVKCLSSILFSIESYLEEKASSVDDLQRWVYYLDQCLNCLLGICPSVLTEVAPVLQVPDL